MHNQLPKYEPMETKNKAPGRVPLPAPPGAPVLKQSNLPNPSASTLKCQLKSQTSLPSDCNFSQIYKPLDQTSTSKSHKQSQKAIQV